MDLTIGLSDAPFPFFTGLVGSDSSVGGNIAILGDRWYVVDLKSERFRMSSIPALRPQQDTSERPGEQSLTVEGLWRRVASLWTSGAGQRWYDRDDAVATRFFRSRGVDPWTPWELSPLPAVTRVTTATGGWTSMATGIFGGIPRLVAAGSTNRAITVRDTGSQLTTITGVVGRSTVTSDGANVYLADDNGIHKVNSAATGLTSYNSNIDTADLIFFGKNRLFAAKGPSLWDVHTDNTETDIADDVSYLDNWRWTGATSGQEALFFSGYAGDKGRIFAVTLADDATTLNPPVVALELPDGEIPWCLCAYVGFVVIGTNLGVRIAQQNGAQLVNMGPLVGVDPEQPTGHDVRCLEPQDRFVWFGWDDTFADAAGLGRVDLKTFVEALAPAFATDLMATEAGDTTAVATFGNRRWFCTGTGLYRQADTYVTSGYVETGRVTFNVADDKTSVFADLRHSPLRQGESVQIEIAPEASNYSIVGSSTGLNTTRPVSKFPANYPRSVYYDMKVTLTGTGTRGPILTGVTLAAQIAPDRSFNIFLPLILAETVYVNEQDYPMAVTEELDYLVGLVSSQRLVRFRHGKWSSLAFAEDYEWIPHHATTDGEELNGTLVLKLKSAEIVRG